MVRFDLFRNVNLFSLFDNCHPSANGKPLYHYNMGNTVDANEYCTLVHQIVHLFCSTTAVGLLLVLQIECVYVATFTDNVQRVKFT